MDTKNFSFISSLKRKNTGIMTSFDSIHKEYWFSNGIWSEPVDWPQEGSKIVTMLKKEAKKIVTLLWKKYWYIAEDVRALGHIQISDEIAILLLPYFIFFFNFMDHPSSLGTSYLEEAADLQLLRRHSAEWISLHFLSWKCKYSCF